ncbi:MAG: putative helicase [Myxococcaceae bacterium]|nr:putative helicase [Myxococcaceae bacterium]
MTKRTVVARGALAVRLADLSTEERVALERGLRMRNPSFSRGATSEERANEWLPMWRIQKDFFIAPRESLAVVRDVLGDVTVDDRTSEGDKAPLVLRTALRDYQIEATKELATHRSGLLVVPTGGGKTVVGCAIAAHHGRATLVLAPTADLVTQWANAATEHLGVEAGVLRGGKATLRPFSVATPQTALKHLDALAGRFGLLLVDEAHRAAAPTYLEILFRFDARYRYGMTATPKRADGLESFVTAHLGPALASVNRPDLEDAGHLERPVFVTVPTDFTFAYAGPTDWPRLLDALFIDDARNQLLVDTIARECRDGATGLVLTARVEHAKQLAASLIVAGLRAAALTGDMPAALRSSTLDRARRGELDVVTATSLADEGLDLPRISRLFLVAPGKAESRLIQRVGRVLRPHPKKGAPIVFDFVDVRSGVLANQARKRDLVFAEHWAAADPPVVA